MQRIGLLAIVMVCLEVLASPSAAQDDEFERPNFDAGLLGVYQHGENSIRRYDAQLLFDWTDGVPDARLTGSPDKVVWSGRLLVRRRSNYRFRVYATGSVEIKVAGNVALKGNRRQVGWIDSESSPISFGYHPLEVTYVPPKSGGRIALFWESEWFELEPIAERNLLHDPVAAEISRFQRGQTLHRALRCNACHEHPAPAATVPAPSLTRLRGAVHPGWLVDYLQHPQKAKNAVAMPDLGLSESEAKAVSAYLLDAGNSAPTQRLAKGRPEEGRALIRNLGCLACHTLDGAGKEAPFGGGDLSRIAAKRPIGFFARWLAKPESLNAKHRMPIFELEKQERADISAYLCTLGEPAEQKLQADKSLVRTGASLIRQKRCASCHEIPGVRTETAMISVATSGTNDSCMGDPDPTNHRPGYRLSDQDRLAIKTYITSLPKEPVTVSIQQTGKQLLGEKGCLNCHARGAGSGLREVVAQLGVLDPKKQAALVPPSLNSLGDKMQPAWLKEAVSGKATRLRPWLAPRMPRFKHSTDEAAAMVSYFRGTDLIPAGKPKQPNESPPSSEMMLAAHQLVGATGMGCMSCHTIADHEPKGVELGARGSDLRFLGKRLRKTWFRRWTRNPSRIASGIEMPAIALAAPGILDGRIGTQLDALWMGLNAPRFDLPSANAVQVLAGQPGEPAVILRDPFEHDEEDYKTRPFAVGLANGHNLLIDLDTLSLRRWWIGDFAQQKTRGKTWYWQTAGVTLLDAPEPASLITLSRKGQTVQPAPKGQAVTRLEWFEHVPEGARFKTRVCFPHDEWVTVTLTFRATQKGLILDAKASDVPPDANVELQLPIRGTSDRRIPFTSDVGPASVTALGDEAAFSESSPCRLSFSGTKATVSLTSPVSPPKASKPQVPMPASEAKDLPCLPGYEVTRLPLPQGPMITAMTWRPDGTLAIASLKGGVFLVKDGDDDGLLDTYRLFSDHLAAPYGLLADGDDLIVSHKQEVLRLVDRDKDGRAERSEVVATGWGVTFDYHDWTVGLVRDGNGALYVSPSCQQDDRTPASAIGRGKVLKIAPDGNVSEFAAGIRFAMGLAMNDHDELFATDNQGVTNPFNELNFIRKGRHYGFWSKLEARSDGQVTTRPAIQIPHPWTRSVNGVAFVPADAKFGPFSGHLLGVDYNLRKIIRMTLQRVGDDYQGCAYPFSLEDLKLSEDDKTFLGPVALAFAPDGALYVGSMLDSGWGGGNNRGTIARVRYTGSVPFGIQEVTAHSQGFDIRFTGPADPALAADAANYSLSCYTRIPKGGYATPDQDRTTVVIKRVEVSKDRRSVRLFARPLRPTFVYDVAIDNVSGAATPPWPDVAYYTLNHVPKE